MFRGQSSNFRGRGRARGGGRNPQQRSPRGLFADGVWHCDCTPRLPAEHFRVKKEGPNQGRWFYTCQQGQNGQGCGFFLWDDDAKPREEAAVLSGSRTEPGDQDGWNAGRSRNERPQAQSPPPAYSALPPPTTGTKRSAREARLEVYDEDDPWSLDADDEERFDRLANVIAPVTPHKLHKTSAYPTPATTAKRTLPQARHSPTSQDTEDSDYSPSKRLTNASSVTLTPGTNIAPQTPTASSIPAQASTPSPPTRHKDALTNPADEASSLTSEVLSCLSSARIPASTLSSLRSILTKHDLRAQGVKAGRDVSRLQLNVKDAKIAELQARITSLEADRELERAVGRMSRKNASS